MQVYDSAAIVTAYFVGTITFPEGVTIEGTWRYSETWIQHEGQWKIVHYHFSPLAPTQPETSLLTSG